MDGNELERLRSIKTFPSLVKYLRDELDWPIETDDFEDLTFDYEPDELGIDSKIAVKIKEIKQLRPLSSKQPWGIFFVNFAPKRLPVVVLRRVLQSLVIKKRQSANKATQMSWLQTDLLFISSYGESEDRAITFAHFTENKQMGDLPVLKVLGWDKDDTASHLADAHDSLKEKLSWPDDEEDLTNWRKSWASAFILRHREVVETSKQLAIELADLATNIRARTNQVLAVEDTEKGPMRKLMAGFKEALIHDLSDDDFADMYAQTIAYGLLAAAISRHVPGEGVALIADNIADMVPVTNPFLKELLGTFLTVGGRKKKLDFDELGINDIIDLLRNANLTAVLHDFGNQNPLEDPVIHFYELFLKEYDAKKRMKRGVFYTPKPVVSFIVRSVHEILKKEFGLQYGLADITTWGEIIKRIKVIEIPDGVSPNEPFVQILDPATGTGTFLVETIDVIYKAMTGKWENEGHMPLEFYRLWNEYVPKHLLPRLNGFELLMAPYTIAHMKVGLKLKETGYRFQSNERVRIYLTNTLEKPKNLSEYFKQMAPALAHEAKAADKVKTTVPITIAIGNPPYSKISSNLTPEVRSIIDKYRYVGDEKIVERGALQFEINLQDDYVKFISFCENLFLRNLTGIMGMITNNGYLTTPTLRGMRYSLKSSFDNISIVDLHGHLAKGERDLQGNKEENVFDIQQGVAIFLGRRTKASHNDSLINHCDLYGSRQIKYEWLLSNFYKHTLFKPVDCIKNFFLYKPQNLSLANEFESMFDLQDIFKQNGAGVITARDGLVLNDSKESLEETMDAFRKDDRSPEVIYSAYNFKPSKRFDLRESQKQLRSISKLSDNIKPILYRPFDNKYIFYYNAVIWSMSRPTAIHMFNGDNLALVATRQVTRPKFEHVFVTRNIIEIKACSHDRNTQLFPLYVTSNSTKKNELSLLAKDRKINLSEEYIVLITNALNTKFSLEESSQRENSLPYKMIFNYIYSFLHSDSYRTRYFEFLKSHFPRIPITSKLSLFNKLSDLGDNLIKLHLFESELLSKTITDYPRQGDNFVTKVGEKGKTLADVKNSKGKLYINKTQYFDNLPEEVWNFHIGGYQVCHKWLAGHKKAGRKLSAEDIEHYHKIVVAINETINIMKQIDHVIDAHGGWPIK